MKHRTLWLVVVCLLFASCSSDPDESKPCVPGTQEGCEPPLMCELASDIGPVCVAGVFIEGRVVDASTGSGIPGASVLAMDASGGAVTDTAWTNGSGDYSMYLSLPRDADGKLLDPQPVTLRVSAGGYQSFPLPPRTAIPVPVVPGAMVSGDDRLTVKSAATNVSLLRLAGDSTSLAKVCGRILDAEDQSGFLVAAVVASRAVTTAISDHAGAFCLFNVPVGSLALVAWKSGYQVDPVNLQVAKPEVSDADLNAHPVTGTTISGKVEIVNASGGQKTSVVLVPKETFDSSAARGENPAGLRAGDVDGSFSIQGVPPGSWVALAAFENDGLVRDPDSSIGGTAVVEFETEEDQAQLTLPDSFKVTGAIAIVSPGATGLETITSQNPSFAWEPDSSAKGYDLTIRDALGDIALQQNDISPDEVKVNGESQVIYNWIGADLQPGMIYQFKVRSWRGDTWDKTYISQTEDLLGLFQFSPES